MPDTEAVEVEELDTQPGVPKGPPTHDSLQAWQKDIDDALDDVEQFSFSNPQEVIMAIGQHASRMTSIATICRRYDMMSSQQACRSLREQCGFVLKQLEFQFNIATQQLESQ